MLKNSQEHPALDAEGWRWAWEFLRRSPAYQTFWREKCVPYLGRFYEWPYHDEAIERFAFAIPSSPDKPRPPLFLDIWTCCVGDDAGATADRIKSVRLKKSEVAFVVDLARPLAYQLEGIARAAKEKQAARGKIKQPRERRDKYGLYLDILDAMAAGQKAETIRDTLFSELDHHEHPSPRHTAYSKARKAAIAMRDGGYKKLIGGV